jgi:hypothetical protein
MRPIAFLSVVPRADGMLIYKQLGASAQEEFSKTWGIGYALNSASEWQEVAKTAAQAALLIVLLDLLRITRNGDWFSEHGARAALRGALHALRARHRITHTYVRT